MQKLALTALLALILVACKKEKDRLIDSLPEISMDGRNTFGFLVEGRVWIPQCSKQNGGRFCGQVVTFMPSNKQFELSLEMKIKNVESYFHFYIDSLFSEGICTSHSTMSFIDGRGTFVQNGGYYDNICGGDAVSNITINKLDTINKTVSGRFDALNKELVTNLNFQDLYPTSPEYIEIKEGRFDIHYY